MAGEGQDCLSKHYQETGGSSSSQAPTTDPKELSKKARPSSFQEESSPEDSPPHGGSPKSLDELECLKIHALIVHTNREALLQLAEGERH
jgi:hypothetical protein